jgi:hypothetical protein
MRRNLNAENAKNRLNKNAFRPLASYSGKSTRHETAETAKPWVDQYFVGKVLSVAPGLRGKKGHICTLIVDYRVECLLSITQ